ncbi:phosphoenolpyruvate synthase [Candidatus Pacearchaeota archaeon]|nr:phosphoenolpyruvate synthase [Candidatus Pacearchaeota archaeon]|tara:strand:+ start:8374 stop:10872 length:2499 start_codon:yes stop_codon:yes gene_type:complete
MAKAGDKYILWLSDLSKKDINLAGGKGANLGEMYNAKFPVPQAFVVTTKAFNHFLKQAKIEDEIKTILHKINVDDTSGLSSKAEEIRKLITESKMPKDLEDEIRESYDHFNIDLSQMKDSPGALSILKSAREPIFVSVRSSATAEDLGDASFAGQQESFINVKGNADLMEKIKRVFASIFTARSIFYRKKKGFEGLVPIAAVVQKMINSDKSGVMFSKNPVNGKNEILIESVWGQGEGIVSGKIKPDQHVLSSELEVLSEEISEKKLAVVRTAGGQTKTVELVPERSKERVLRTYELKQLAEYALKLEEHYKNPQDIEFSIEDDSLYILQTRPITTIKERGKAQEIDGRILTAGMAASPGVASGVVKIVKSMEDLKKIKEGDVLVTKMTNPDMVVSMQKAAAIVTSEGGVTAHAAIVSREMGIPAIVGAQDALDVLDDRMEITVDGNSGKVFAGKAENRSVEIRPIVTTKTKIKVMVDLPKFAERAAKTEADGIGLVRLEGLIAMGGKHPLGYKSDGELGKYKEMLKTGLKQIAEKFIGKPIWVRSSDIRSDEYSNLEGAPKDKENNPMLGDHGIRFSLRHPEILKAELNAIKELSETGHKFGVMFPQIISVDEIKKTREIFKEVGCEGKVKFGIMVETPAAAILIKDLCQEGLDFISFGTNDLTQYTLAIDRGNDDVQYIYDEMNWAVLKQLSRVIRECKSQGVETSICGQAGSKKEMVEFLVKQGIDSISVNADVAREISKVVLGLEEGEVPKEEEKPKEKVNEEPETEELEEDESEQGDEEYYKDKLGKKEETEEPEEDEEEQELEEIINEDFDDELSTPEGKKEDIFT